VRSVLVAARAPSGHYALVRTSGLVLVPGFLLLCLPGCSSDSNSIETLNVESTSDVSDLPDPVPALPDGARSLVAVIIDAPASVAANEDFDFVVELRNRSMEAIDLSSPCPWFHAVFGESGTNSDAVGQLPCDELGPIASGGRTRLRIPMTAPTSATAGEGGEWAELSWRLGNTGSVIASIPLPMDGI
jgi:hypothetical protein